MAVVGTDVLVDGVDYELPVDDSTASDQARILRGRALEDEEEERRKKRRIKIMQMSQAAASVEPWHRMEASRGVRLVDTLMADRGEVDDIVEGFSDLVGMDSDGVSGETVDLGVDADDDGGQDTDVADGLSLALGSDTHEDYVRVREGFDGFDLERAHLAEIGFGTKSDLVEKSPDEFHEDYDQATFEYSDEINDDFEAEREEMRETNGSRILYNRVTKDADAEHIVRAMQDVAKHTKSLADDELVDEIVSREVDTAVENDSVSDLVDVGKRVEYEVREFESPEMGM